MEETIQQKDPAKLYLDDLNEEERNALIEHHTNRIKELSAPSVKEETSEIERLRHENEMLLKGRRVSAELREQLESKIKHLESSAVKEDSKEQEELWNDVVEMQRSHPMSAIKSKYFLIRKK